ncbi:MAG: zinc ribbon domain-containing protein, partial [Coleofasciculus sp. G2-EDA-02]
SVECSQCKVIVKKSLSTRTHVCKCGLILQRDWNAAINILLKAKSRGGHPQSKAVGVGASTQQERKPGRASFDVEYRIPRALSPWECQSRN